MYVVINNTTMSFLVDMNWHCVGLRPARIVCWLLIGASCLAAQSGAPAADGIDNLSLAELANTSITSVARKPQRLSQAAAAIFVITRDDIRRSGAVSLPDVLRLAPGVQVARINQSEWAITARGFNGRWANKLLVLLDGRTVYSPLFSGVHWESLDLPLEDIERIEVIRGPGATVWGANAVNGVINILTRAAVDTQGTTVSLAVGNTDRVATSIRHGGRIGDRGHFRVNSRYYDRKVDSDQPWGNQWKDFRGGFRADWRTSTRDSFVVTGDVFRAAIHSAYTPVVTRLNPRPAPVDMNYAPQTRSLSGRWERKLTDSSDIALQISYAGSHRSEVDFTGDLDTIDVDFQHRMLLGLKHDLVWGFDARTSSDRYSGFLTAVILPDHRRDLLVSGFLQDEISLLPGALQLVLGTKVERNSYMTTPQLEPGAQLIWTPNAANTVWTSVARAVRTPARSDVDIQVIISAVPLPNGQWLTPILLANKLFKPETLTAFELGYRFQRARASFDISGFSNHYDQLRSYETGAVIFAPLAGAPPPVLPLRLAGNVYGESRGLEISSGYELTESVRLLGTYSFLNMRLHRLPVSNDQNYRNPEGESPRHQGRLTCYWNLNRAITWDTSLYLVDRLPAQQLAGYASIVSHVGWQVRKGLYAGITADNLLDRRHAEFMPIVERTGRASGSFGRTVRANIVWSF